MAAFLSRYTITRVMFSLAGKFLRFVLPGVIRPMRVLWNQFIGFLFLVLSVTIVTGAIRRNGDRGTPVLVAAIIFAAFLAYFGVTSFLRARRISRAR